MTLHEAIIQVLKSANRTLTTQQIAEELNRNKIYQKSDGSEITEFQIYSRTRRYPDLFVRDDNSIKLKGDKNIEKIIIENFKKFEGQHVFELNNLNIFTGANNSGKSTLFKAISLFSYGLERGDFPTISLFDDNAGEFDSLVNNYSTEKNFKIGFFIALGEKRIPFKVLYEFVENEYADGSGDKDTGTAKFSKFEVLDINDNVFLGAYDSYKFVITEDNIEYDGDFMRCEYPFRTPSEGSESSMLMMKFNIELLEEHIESFTSTDYSELISHIKTISGKHNNWWSEYFREDNYNYSLIGLTFNELIKNILDDPYCGIGDFRTKKAIHEGNEKDEEIWQEYTRLRDRLNYRGFIKDVFYPLLDSIESGLEFFRKKNFT
jgi:predicted ATP-dependent endonuclease of OLD family